jgi:tripartite-type tricarboxylate transporter receptor subunit TctC
MNTIQRAAACAAKQQGSTRSMANARSMAGLATLAGLAIAAATVSHPVRSAEPSYPDKSRPIQIIVPFSAGGPTDIQTRIVSDFMGRDLGANFVVVPRPGAGSQIGLQQLVTAKPDGYTIGVTNNPTSMGVYLMPSRKATFNRQSFAPIGMFLFDPEVIAVKADGPYKTFKDLIDAAKAKPKSVRVTTNGLFSDDHMAIVSVAKATGAQFALVHFDGTPEEVAGLISGRTAAAFMGIGGSLAHVKSGNLRHLVVMDEQPMAILPGTPTLKSQGVDFTIGSARGMSGPAGMPRAAITVLETSLGKAMKDPSVVEKITAMGTPIRYLNSADFTKFWENMERQIRPSIDLMLADQGIEEKGTAK